MTNSSSDSLKLSLRARLGLITCLSPLGSSPGAQAPTTPPTLADTNETKFLGPASHKINNYVGMKGLDYHEAMQKGYKVVMDVVHNKAQVMRYSLSICKIVYIINPFPALTL